MKSTLEPEDIQAIAGAVAELIRPMLSRNGNEKAEDRLLTIDEVAAFLKTSKAQIYQWVNNSQHGLSDFPFMKAGKLLRFSKKALLKWLERR